MASFEFDNVEAEKEDSLWRYNMEMKLSIALRFIGLLLFLLPSWPCFPRFQAAGDFRRRFVSTFNKPLFTFIVVNVIIVAVYVLSTPKKSHKQSSTNDIYNEYVSSRRSIASSTVVPTAVSNCPIEVDKQFVNGVAIYQVKHRPAIVDTITETKTSLSKVKQHATKIRRVAKTEAEDSSAEVMPKQYRRTRSMVSESRPRDREFRSVSSRELGIEPPRKSMEEMSSEEFQLIIERFIAERKKTDARKYGPVRCRENELRTKSISIFELLGYWILKFITVSVVQ